MPAAALSPPVLPDVVEEHLEELGFLAIQRRKLFVDPDTSLARLAEHDDRAAAHRDGLAIAGPAAGQIADRRLDEVALDWHLAAAARIWLEEGSPSPEAVLERIEAGGDDLLAGWREAFRRTTPAVVERIFPRAAAEPAGLLARRVRADARVWQGRASESELSRLAADGDPLVRRSVARCLARAAASGSAAVRAAAERLCEDESPDVRRRALWSLALADAAAGLTRARRLAMSTGDPFALRVVGLLGDTSDAARLRARPADPAALRALGDLGLSESLEFLRERLDAKDPAVVAAAADAIVMILGFPKDKPATLLADPEMAKVRYDELPRRLDPDAKWLRGRALPHDGPPPQETTESRWRTLVAGAPSPEQHRAEVPDGFFLGLPEEEALCGE